MNYNRFSNLSSYEEFEIQSALTGISKSDVLKEIGHRIDDYYFFVSEDGVFNWFDLNGNHVEDPWVLNEIRKEHIHGNITKCIIPNSVKSIGSSVFYNCKSLKEITIPNSVTSIGMWTFDSCISLTSIIIPDSVTSVGYGAFANCESLTLITIPSSVTSIDYKAFSNCNSLKEIIIPDSVIRIGKEAFSCCNSLKQVIFKGKTLKYVEQMVDYPFGIKDENIFKFS